MANTMNVLLAGFGGQGILFTGKVMVYGALTEGKELSWLPSYGPEMRGGTCNCSVVISDEAIGSPLVTNPDVLIAMNRPSLEKFVNSVVPGGTILVDSSTVFNKDNKLSALSYKIEETTTTTGYLKSYQLTQVNPSTGAETAVGKIDIPKDFLVKSGSVKTVATADTPYPGAIVGDKYIDFVINSKNADDTDSHVYIPVKDLVDVYTGSTYITVNNDNSISLNTTKFETDYINPINQKILNVSTDVSTLDHIVAVMGNDLNDRVADVSQDLIDLTGIVDGLTSGGVMDVSAVKTTTNVNVKNADTGVTADTVTGGVATVTLKQQKGTTYSDVITIENLVTKNTIDEIASLLTAAEVRQNRTDSSVNTIETKVTEIDASIDRLDSSVSALENTLRWIDLGS